MCLHNKRNSKTEIGTNDWDIAMIGQTILFFQ